MKPYHLRVLVLLAVFLALTAFPAAPVHAATCTAANDADLVSQFTDINCTTIQLLAQVYKVNGLTTNHDITLQGAGMTSTTLNGQGNQVLYNTNPYVLTLKDLTIINGHADYGGAVRSFGPLNVDSVEFRSNLADDSGGAIHTQERIIVKNSVFNHNAATRGGAIYAIGAKLTLKKTAFNTNTATDYGGAVYQDGPKLKIIKSTFNDNGAQYNGGYGGAIYVDDGDMAVRGSTFTANTAAYYGGALYLDGASSTLIKSIFLKNSATDNYGGAVYHDSGALKIIDSTFSENTAYEDGGALAGYGDSLTITGSTFDHNIARPYGYGAAIALDEDADITNTTFAYNECLPLTSGYYGGAVVIYNGYMANFTNVTFFANKASMGGNLMVWGTANLKNTLLAGGYPDNCDASDGAINSLGSNLSSDSSCLPYLTADGDQNGKDPLLGALQNNGGLTETLLPQPGSPAINTVRSLNCPPPDNDQRGIARPQGVRCDVGAVEAQ